MSAHNQPVLDETDLNDADTAILNELHEGRGTPKFLATRLQTDRSYVSQRLKRLQEHDHVTKLETGLYQLTHDPRDEPPSQPDSERQRFEELEAKLQDCREELQQTRNNTASPQDAPDHSQIENALKSLTRAENDLPENAPGRSSLMDAIHLLEQAINTDE